MRAIILDKQSGTAVWSKVPAPPCGDNDVRISVHAAGVNRADLLQRAGKYDPPPGESPILGLEVSGVITEVGANVSRWRVENKVCALVAGGAYASEVVVDEKLLMPLPAGWDFAMGAALPEAYITAYTNLFLEGTLGPGEKVLIHAGGSGIGVAAIQLVRSVDSEVFVTVRSAEKVAKCREIGAHHVFNSNEGDFVEKIRNATNGIGVDLILDPVGGAFLSQNLEVLRHHGRLVIIATLGGSKAELPIPVLMRKQLRIIGSVLRTRTKEEKGRIISAFLKRFLPLLEQNRIRPLIDSQFGIEQVDLAHERMRQNQNFGKIILKIQ